MSQPQAQRNDLLPEPSLEIEGEDADPATQAPEVVETQLNKRRAAARDGVGGRFAKAMAKDKVDHFKADCKSHDDDDTEDLDDDEPDESEEDPDDEETLEAHRTAMTGKSQASQHDSVANQPAGNLDPNDLSSQLEEDLNAAFEELSNDVSQSPKVQAPGASSKSKPSQGKCEQASLEDLIRVYSFKKIETKNGFKREEPARMFIDRNEANEVARAARAQYLQQAKGTEQSCTQSEKAGMFFGTVVLNARNSLAVSVASEIRPASDFGVDVTKMDVPYVQQVWVIKRKLEKTVTDPKTEQQTLTTSITEDAVDLVYTDRELANYQAAQNMIAFLKPKDSNFDDVLEWSNIVAPAIRDERARQDEAGSCLTIEVDRTENVGQLEWLEWDVVAYTVEVKKTKGPQN